MMMNKYSLCVARAVGGNANASYSHFIPPHKVKGELPLCFKADESANERSELALALYSLFENERSRKHFAFSYEKAISSYYALRGGLDIFT